LPPRHRGPTRAEGERAVSAPAEPLKPDRVWIRYLGILTAIALVTMALAVYVLPGRLGMIVGACAILFGVLAGSQFVFHAATMVSMALHGRRRTQFQIAVSLAVPAALALFLASRADDVPVETLLAMLTPWLLVPLGVIAWVCWFAGGQLNRDHPFRGFIIAAAILGVLCLFWSAGMISVSDYDGEGSSLYLDPEKAKRAKEIGEYVWRFVLYVTTAYLALFLKLKRPLVFKLKWPSRESSQDEAFRKLNDALTPDAVQDIVSRMGGYIADREASPGREADLPFPKVVIELAYIKAMRDCTDPRYLDLLKAVYITLDDYMLSNEECAILTKFRDVLQQAIPPDTDTLMERFNDVDMQRTQEINARLSEAMHRRSATIAKILKKSD